MPIHSKQHDLLQLTRFEDHAAVDAPFDTEAQAYLTKPPRRQHEHTLSCRYSFSPPN